MIDGSLLIGLTLIGAGLGLGAIAFFLMTRGRGKEDEGETAEAQPPEEQPSPLPRAEVQEERPLGPSPPPPQPPAAEVPSPPPEPEPTVAPAPVPSSEPTSRPSTGEVAMPETPAEPSPAPQPEDRLFPVVTLMRDDITGELALRVGNRTYRTVAELRDSTDLTRVEYAARDLTRWMEGKASPPQPKREDRPAEAAPVGGTMVEQINRILERKLAGRPVADRAVRLVEGPGGSVRVYVGVHGYALDEVPEAAIRSIIRDAVAEWEANR
jgi:hypothetical protein